MNAVEITGFLGLAVTAAATLVVPLLLIRQDRRMRATEKREEVELRRQEKAAEDSEQGQVTWQSLNVAMKGERDTALERADSREQDYKAAIEKLERDHVEAIARADRNWQSKLDVAMARIRALETVVTDLYRQLHGLPPLPKDNLLG